MHSVHALMHVQINFGQQEALVHLKSSVQVIKIKTHPVFLLGERARVLGQSLTISWVFRVTYNEEKEKKQHQIISFAVLVFFCTSHSPSRTLSSVHSPGLNVYTQCL